MSVLLSKDTITLYRAKEGSYVDGVYVSGYQQIKLTLSDSLITDNTFEFVLTSINQNTGVEIVTTINQLFDISHLNTMNLIKTAIELDTVGIDTALVSGTGNKILTITANDNYMLTVSGIDITGGLTQSSVTSTNLLPINDATELLTFTGNIQPDFGDSDYLTIKDEKARTGKDNIGIIKVFNSTYPFLSQSNSPMGKADLILYNDKYFEVRGTSSWEGINLNHYKALAFLVDS